MLAYLQEDRKRKWVHAWNWSSKRKKYLIEERKGKVDMFVQRKTSAKGQYKSQRDLHQKGCRRGERERNKEKERKSSLQLFLTKSSACMRRKNSRRLYKKKRRKRREARSARIERATDTDEKRKEGGGKTKRELESTKERRALLSFLYGRNTWRSTQAGNAPTQKEEKNDSLSLHDRCPHELCNYLVQNQFEYFITYFVDIVI